jgi:hypothetical protein
MKNVLLENVEYQINKTSFVWRRCSHDRFLFCGIKLIESFLVCPSLVPWYMPGNR